jgi:hypothetical protein
MVAYAYQSIPHSHEDDTNGIDKDDTKTDNLNEQAP